MGGLTDRNNTRRPKRHTCLRRLKARRLRSRRSRRRAGWKTWTMRIALVLLSPVVFLLLIEAVLWLSGFGRPTGFFIEWDSPSGQSYHITNRDFCLQFVPKELSREPEPVVLAAKDYRLRIFVVGGSAAAGDPDARFGFCRVLEAVLNRGGRDCEVVNAAVTAMGSHVVRRIAADCADRDADALIVYMGNNEVVGPYGPASVPAALYGSTRMIRTMIAARGTRVGQLIGRLATGRNRVKHWQGMEAFLEQRIGFDDPRLEDCYGHFRSNLDDILSDADDASAPVVLCTVPTNIRSCAPFASQHAGGLTDEQLARWDALYAAGRKARQSGQFAQALEKYRAAGSIDEAHAELAFATARCAEKLGDLAAARQYYTRARDLDALRFRADTRINAIIRSRAEAASGRVALADLAGEIERHAKGKLPGSDLLVDHVHLNFRANFLAAVTAARALDRLLPGLDLDLPDAPDDLDKLRRALARQLGYDARAGYDLAIFMYRRKTRPPFVGQLDHDARMAALRTELVELRKAVKRLDDDLAERLYLAAAAGAPLDPVPDRLLGELWLRGGKIDQAVARHRERLGVYPHCVTTRKALAKALAAAGQTDQAVEVLTSPANPFATDEKRALAFIGSGLIGHQQVSLVRTVYERILELDPEDVDAMVNLGACATEDGRYDEAEKLLKRALDADADHVKAMVNLANSFVKRKMFAQARQWFDKAVETDPYSHLAHIGLGLRLAQERRYDEGIKHLKRAVELHPGFAGGYQILALLHLQRGDRDRAAQYAKLAELFSAD